ncbi:MAG: hypothetical protein GXO96_00220 [Nitrospirae bacterium]|nr:hypothetical protein [Candidatus Manganitrophaceae bacterium]
MPCQHDISISLYAITQACPLSDPFPNGLDWTVLYDPSPEFEASPLSRCIWIKAVADLSEIAPLLAPLRNHIQAVGIAIPKTRADKNSRSLE